MGDYIDRAQYIAEEYTQRCVEQQLAHAHNHVRPADGPRSCEACGVDIPAARLRAVPDALLCVDCQELEERRHGRNA
ncbi:TPA: TraR/DksA C4-type zinc finger protein [Salmonella enterica subsp. enterica serovar Infantis]|nr:TraR/DksA C4-type zinc finger protein [Salmonella enterica subsp. enterica serovar Infantis]HCJ0429064.1 TraR/DksA C4-type zinc finger protein [Salmonella enterica subsp. enterica serovar Infantis]